MEELRRRVATLELELGQSREELSRSVQTMQRQEALQAQELAALRHRVVTIGQQFESAAARFTDQKTVIEGLQAIARLVKAVP